MPPKKKGRIKKGKLDKHAGKKGKKKGKKKSKKLKKKPIPVPEEPVYVPSPEEQTFLEWLEELVRKHMRPPIELLAYKFKEKYIKQLKEKLRNVRSEQEESCFKDIEETKSKTIECKGLGISPINIDTKEVKRCRFLRLASQGLWDTNKFTTLENSGTTVAGKLQGEAYIWNGPLFGTYKLSQFHFHWGKTAHDGTEHAFNEERFALEMHLLFLPAECGDSPQTVQQQKKQAVLALLFKESTENCFYEVLSYLDGIVEPGKSVVVSKNLLSDFKDIVMSSEYYNYCGSLTTPPYTPTAEWLVFKKVLPIQKFQMKAIKKLKNKDGPIRYNTAEIQPLEKRIVFTPIYEDHRNCRGEPVCRCFSK